MLMESLKRDPQVTLEDAFFVETPEEIMRLRWLRILNHTIPEIDLDDIQAVLANPQHSRQFAAEYSQSSYKTMLAEDYAVGDYLCGD